jgi:hypothetical protein
VLVWDDRQPEMSVQLDPRRSPQGLLPDIEFDEVRVIESGWDTLVLDLDDEWSVRIHRGGEVEEWLERR